jgi:hypothetical protein
MSATPWRSNYDVMYGCNYLFCCFKATRWGRESTYSCTLARDQIILEIPCWPNSTGVRKYNRKGKLET